jgi:hypothetical protein
MQGKAAILFWNSFLHLLYSEMPSNWRKSKKMAVIARIFFRSDPLGTVESCFMGCGSLSKRTPAQLDGFCDVCPSCGSEMEDGYLSPCSGAGGTAKSRREWGGCYC